MEIHITIPMAAKNQMVLIFHMKTIIFHSSVCYKQLGFGLSDNANDYENVKQVNFE